MLLPSPLKLMTFYHLQKNFRINFICRRINTQVASIYIEETPHNQNISDFCARGKLKEAIQFLLNTNIKVLPSTYTCLLDRSIHTGAFIHGKMVHTQMIKTGFEPSTYLETKLIIMYAKCGELRDARQLFDKMPERNLVTWNAMVAGYSLFSHWEDTMEMYHRMRSEGGFAPDNFTLPSVLRACSGTASLEEGRRVHAVAMKLSNFSSHDIVLGTALVDMYGKCGIIEDARNVFDKMPEKNVLSWTAIISGYGSHGMSKQAFMLFEEMQKVGLRPNYVTLVAILSACSHAGLVDEAWYYFNAITRGDYAQKARIEHYSCMVDLLGRVGKLEEAYEFIKSMPIRPNCIMWGSLLGACRIHGNMKLGQICAENLIQVGYKGVGKLVILSNMYAAAGKWKDVLYLRKTMRDMDLQKEPGCSWIEHGRVVHSFLVGDTSHPQSVKIYAVLESLIERIKHAGYVPRTDCVLHDVEDGLKESFLLYHSEKLAVAFGIINVPRERPIRVVKNLRVCGDCHSAMKFICLVESREIILRDVKRYHHFKDGRCSCGDYW